MTLSRLLALIYFMCPAYAANMAPPWVRYWRGWNPPLSRRWLGDHKTVLGVAAGVVAALVAAGAQELVGERDGLGTAGPWIARGLLFGLGAMGGDLLKSFCKRRLGIAPGKPWVPFDQLDFQVGALLLVGPGQRLSCLDVAALLALGFAGDLAVNRLAFRLGIKQAKW